MPCCLWGEGKASWADQCSLNGFCPVGSVIVKLLTVSNSGLHSACFQCGIIYWLFGGAVRNLGGPAHVTQWLQPLQVWTTLDGFNESESHSVVSYSFRPMGYTVHGILQTRILEWIAKIHSS